MPLLGERLFWFASVHVPRFAEEAVPEEEEALLEWLGEAYAGWHAPIGDVIAAGHGAAHVLREDVLELHQPLPAWTSPSLNLALLGDAAHPLSPNLAQVSFPSPRASAPASTAHVQCVRVCACVCGQGAAVAVEEAVELGHLLAGQVGAGQGHKGAVRHWERRRRARAAACSYPPTPDPHTTLPALPLPPPFPSTLAPVLPCPPLPVCLVLWQAGRLWRGCALDKASGGGC